MMRWWLLAAAVIVAPLPVCAETTAPASSQDVVIHGVMRDSDRGSYRELSFDVPEGVAKLTIDVQSADHKGGTYLVLGVYDPTRERGWGGAIKPHIVIAETFASSSYLPGPLPAGRWRLSVAVASIRPGAVSPYTMTVHFDRGAAAQAITTTALKTGPGWYRGDFHTHTGQSDALCRSEPRADPVPCPVYFTLKAARDHQLDFVTVTDHNVRSQVAELADLAPFFDSLLVIPGRKMTTQSGHYNLLGVTDFVEYRLGAVGAPTINAVFDGARGTGAIISINHPEIPTDENCLGCRWSAPNTDYARVGAIEVANGGIAADHGGAFDDRAGSGTAWWEVLLDRGYHLTSIGGSDNHDAIDGHAGSSPVGAQSPVATPTTVVYASELSQAGILAGVRSGRVFIDLEGAHPGRVLDLTASTSGQATAVIGGTLRRHPGQAIHGTIRVAGADGDIVDLIVDGRDSVRGQRRYVVGSDARIPFGIPAREKVHWLRADIRTPDGKRVLISNPIYVVR